MKYKNIDIKWLGHDSFLINFNEKNIYIDPFKLIGNFLKADYIFITHSHYDHFSIDDIKKIFKSDTKIIGTTDVISQLNSFGNINFQIAEPGKNINIDSLKIICVPAYNIYKTFHPRSNNWVGYIIDFFGTKIYHSGDSDFIPEMKNVKTNIALLPVSGKYTMDVNETINACIAMKPDLAIPMHWGKIIGSQEDAEKFVSGCKAEGINAMILEKE